MFKREPTTKPSPRSFAYDLDGVTVHLLPIDPTVSLPVQRRLAALYEEAAKAAEDEGKTDEVMPEGADARTRIAVAALLAFAAWDTPEIEWSYSGEADEVCFLEGPALLEAAEACRREMFSPSTLRVGVGPDLITAVYRAMNRRAGLTDEEQPAPGEEQPAES